MTIQTNVENASAEVASADIAGDTLADEELMLRYAQGDSEAFDLLFARHKRSVLAFIRGYIRSHDQAEDLMQTVFLRIIRNRNHYQAKARFTTWLFTIVRSVCIDVLRKEKNRGALRLIDGQLDENFQVERIQANEPTPREAMHLASIEEAIHEAVAALPTEQREVLLLRENTGLTFAEIAQLIGCGENTAKSRMYYAMTALRRHLELRGITA